MEPITWAIAGELLFKYGPTFFSLAEKIITNVKAGKANTEVTPAELTELARLSNQTGEDIYLRLGVKPPPPA